MEFNFDDDLFESSSIRENLQSRNTNSVYVPKHCYNQWYISNMVENSTSDEGAFVLKYQADLLYATKHYNDALKKYKGLALLVNTKNPTICRDVNESILRCCIKLGNYEEAYKLLPVLFIDPNNPSDTSIHILAHKICKAVSKTDALMYLHNAINGNPQYFEYHFFLYEIYKSLLADGISDVLIRKQQFILSEDLLKQTLLQARNFLVDATRGRKIEASKKCECIMLELEKELCKFGSHAATKGVSLQSFYNFYSNNLEINTKKRDKLMMEEATFFSGNVLDRCSELRTNTKWINETLQNDSSKIILFKNCDPLVEEDGEFLHLCIFSFKDLMAKVQKYETIFLGRDLCTGVAWFAFNVCVPGKDKSLETVLYGKRRFLSRWFELLRLKNDHASIVSQAKSVFHWHDRYRFCSTCGNKMIVEEAGYKRTCLNKSCRSNKGVHNTCYPRTDPTVIMCVVSSTGEKCLLGRKRSFPLNMYSCLAGFLEPGECIEDAVVRETKEESDIDVANVRYIASQPWPYPSSLMIGCLAEAKSEDIKVCEQEMEDVRWFDKKEIQLALKKECKHLRLPPEQAIAHRLMKHWINESSHTPTSVL